MYKAENNWRRAMPAFFYWLATIGYMGLIYYLSSLSHFGLPEFPRNFDKVIHTCAYIPLAYLLYLSLQRSGVKKHVFLVAFIIACLYGITDELHQSAVPGRDAALGDAAADALGAFLGSFGASIKKN